MPEAKTDAPKRQHKATFATDKRNPGGYLIRVVGPNAAKFGGRDVPVTRKDDSESVETLGACIWTGTDEETNRPVALYRFVSRPRDDDAEDELPF